MAYVSISELQRVLNLPAPTAAQTDAMQRALDAAAEEIDWELGYAAAAPAPSPKSSFSPYGIIPTGPDVVPVFAARDSWYRHKLTLLPLKTEFGVG